MPDKIVLFAEDNPDDVELTRAAFEAEKFPFEVVVAQDGEEALDFLFARGRYSERDRGRVIAGAILDVRMPKVDGLQVLQEIRRDPTLASLKAVMLTTSDDPRDVETAERLKADLYLKKPLSFAEFGELVRRIAALFSS